MDNQAYDEEELEDKEDEARDRQVAKALDDMTKRYRTLFGNDPDEKLSIAEIQEKIRTKSPRLYRL